jgi:pimeloyl-ACP methyl ester carboxylesterase
VEEYISVLSQPGALTAAFNWYRGSEGLRPDQGDGSPWPACAVPTLLTWGKNDMAIGRAAVEAGASYMTGPYELLELDCGHWIVQEALEDVVGPIVEHLRRNARR